MVIAQTHVQAVATLQYLRLLHGHRSLSRYYVDMCPLSRYCVDICLPVFEIKVLFCAPLGCTHIETVRPVIFLCTPLVYCNEN